MIVKVICKTCGMAIAQELLPDWTYKAICPRCQGKDVEVIKY